MRIFLYSLSSAGLLVSASGLALLPRMTSNWWLFGFFGAALTGLMAVSWLGARATAETWLRPRTGPALIVAGTVAAGVSLWDGQYFAVAWAALVLLGGVGMTFPPGRRGTALDRPYPGPVRPPLGRREEG